MDKKGFFIYLSVATPLMATGLAAFYNGMSRYERAEIETVPVNRSYCRYDPQKNEMSIVNAQDGKSLLRRSLPFPLFSKLADQETLETKDGPSYASGTRYKIDFKNATCRVDDFYNARKITYMLQNDQMAPT